MSWRVLKCRRAIFPIRTINFAVGEPVVLLKKNPVSEEKATAPSENMVNLNVHFEEKPKKPRRKNRH